MALLLACCKANVYWLYSMSCPRPHPPDPLPWLYSWLYSVWVPGYGYTHGYIVCGYQVMVILMVIYVWVPGYSYGYRVCGYLVMVILRLYNAWVPGYGYTHGYIVCGYLITVILMVI